MSQKTNYSPLIKEHIFFVRGMHCASCEILIEKNLLELKEVKSVEASTKRGEVLVEYEGEKPSLEKLNRIFRTLGYTFFDEPIKSKEPEKNNLSFIIGISLLLISGFIILNKLGFSSLINVNSQSALPAFFLLGILAGFSTCAALVGGIVLSMSKQWLELYSRENSLLQKLQPHLLFNAGRMTSYAFFGAVLGLIGSRLQISLTFTSILVISVSIIMFFLALQMLGIKSFQKFQITMPKIITQRLADEKKFKGRFLPFLMGAATFFLPCGFTITSQGLALLSGRPLQGGLIMFLFALGTAFPLLIIGLSSVKFSAKPHLSNKFLRVAGIMVLFFALFNINSQLNVLGAPSLNNLTNKLIPSNNGSVQINNDSGLPSIVEGKQILKMDASSSGYKPNYFKVRKGFPVRWEIRDVGTSGCTNAVLARGLFDGEISLTPGQTSIKEFTPTKTGKYKFSCWMGMVSGTIEVVDQNNSSKSAAVLNVADANNEAIVPSGSQGCGCGGGTK